MKSNVQPLFLNHFSGEMSNILGLETYRQLHLWGQIQKKRWPSRLLFLTLYIQQTFIDFINSISIYWPDSVRTLGLQKVIKPRKLTHQHRHLQYRRSIARVVVLKHMNTNPKRSFLEKGTHAWVLTGKEDSVTWRNKGQGCSSQESKGCTNLKVRSNLGSRACEMSNGRCLVIQ